MNEVLKRSINFQGFDIYPIGNAKLSIVDEKLRVEKCFQFGFGWCYN